MTSVAFFAFDISEASQIRRIKSVRALGHDVTSFAFRRSNMNAGFVPDWPNVDIGRTENGGYLRRLALLLRALGVTWRRRALLAAGDVWIARNIDLLMLATATKLLTRRRDVRLVYECLDIHGLFTRPGPVGYAMRWFERRLLARSDLLIVSSPGFLSAYFHPVQGYKGPVALIENKLWFEDAPPARSTCRVRPTDGPLVLAWVGSLRCQESLDLLAETAQTLGGSIRIACHGNVHRKAVPNFDEVMAATPNMTYQGAYRYPNDLSAIYGSVDLVWAQDLWQRGANSDWLLPNRLYEASYFGCPSIACAATETGRRVSEARLGFTVDVPTATALVTLLRRLDRPAISRVADGLLAMPESAFRHTRQEFARALSPALTPLASVKRFDGKGRPARSH